MGTRSRFQQCRNRHWKWLWPMARLRSLETVQHSLQQSTGEALSLRFLWRVLQCFASRTSEHRPALQGLTRSLHHFECHLRVRRNSNYYLSCYVRWSAGSLWIIFFRFQGILIAHIITDIRGMNISRIAFPVGCSATRSVSMGVIGDWSGQAMGRFAAVLPYCRRAVWSAMN